MTITNTSGRPLRARARLVSENPAASTWFSFASEGAGASASAPATDAATPEANGAEVEWDLASDETRHVRVQIAVPADAPQGIYTVRPEVWHVEDPARTLVAGPALAANVPAPAERRRTPWWLWLIPVALVVVVVSAVFAYLWGEQRGAEQAAIATATAEAAATAAAESATATAVAAGGAAAAATATAQAHVTKYGGTWVNAEKAPAARLTRLTITSSGQTITVRMRGTRTDALQAGAWVQKVCPGNASECDLGGPASTTYSGDPVQVNVQTVSPVRHQLTLSISADRTTLSVVDRISLGTAVQRTDGYTFKRQLVQVNPNLVDQIAKRLFAP